MVYQTEEYVQKYLPPYLRSLVAQFRAGILPLEIELGRFRGKLIHERICVVCDNGAVEDETHLLFDCPFYTTLRIIFLNDVYQDNKDFFQLTIGAKMNYLMTHQIKRFAIFLQNCLDKRKTYINRRN